MIHALPYGGNAVAFSRTIALEVGTTKKVKLPKSLGSIMILQHRVWHTIALMFLVSFHFNQQVLKLEVRKQLTKVKVISKSQTLDAASTFEYWII